MLNTSLLNAQQNDKTIDNNVTASKARNTESQKHVLKNIIKADQVNLDIGKALAKRVGKIRYTLGVSGLQDDSSKFVRVFVCRYKDTAKMLNIDTGKAYLIDDTKGDIEFKYIRDVDLSLSDKEITRLFGVEMKD